MSTPLPKDYAFPKDLPAAAIAAFRKVRIAADPAERVDNEEVFADALAAVNYPTEAVPPRADMLTPAQRAFAEVVTDLDLRTTDNDIDRQMPRSKAFRRRWLGFDPASAIDKEISFTLEGKKHKEPAWRAALLLNAADEEPAELFEKLPIADRLGMWGAVTISWPEDFELEADWFFDDGPTGVKTLGAEGGEWAKAYADQFLTAPGK
ncbi:MAG: hypothetical protein ABI461_02230, partial [Polyangiaceae bacterium]